METVLVTALAGLSITEYMSWERHGILEEIRGAKKVEHLRG